MGYIVDYISESGPLTSWQEIKAWSELTGVILEAWEAAVIWKVSVAFVDQLRKSSDIDCPSPWLSGDPVDEKIKTAMRSLK